MLVRKQTMRVCRQNKMPKSSIDNDASLEDMENSVSIPLVCVVEPRMLPFYLERILHVGLPSKGHKRKRIRMCSVEANGTSIIWCQNRRTHNMDFGFGFP